MITTFGIAVAFGVTLVILAQRLELSAISLLLVGGILIGPEVLGLVDPAALGDGLGTIIAICVGVVLFEGGLTLDPAGYRGADKAIRGLLTRGVIITWGCTALAVHVIFDFPWDFSLLTGSLVIVTGPTVIGPLLKRIRVQKRVHHALHWEGVLIDPIGVFIALLCYEWILAGGFEAITTFVTRILVGAVLGPLAGAAIAWVLRARLVPVRSINTFTLSAAIAVFAASDALVHESGLLAVTLAGFVLGTMKVPGLEKVRVYKAELTELLIGLLFILLAAKLELASFVAFGLPLLLTVGLVMLVVRPLNVFVSTLGARMSVREKLFLGWIGPRGIVAASMASLFAMRLAEDGGEHAKLAPFLDAFTYSVIAGTVLFQGLTARWVGGLLGVLEPRSTGWLIIGAHPLARAVARFIEQSGSSAVLLDTNLRRVSAARGLGLSALALDALTVETEDHPELHAIGQVLAVTRNPDLNTLLCQRFHQELPEATLYRWRDPGPVPTRTDLFAGARVWPVLSREALQALDEEADVDADGPRISVETTTFEALAHPEQVLLCCGGETITPFVPEGERGPCTVLRHHPLETFLEDRLRPEGVFFSSAASMELLMQEMLAPFAAEHPELDLDALHAELSSREREFPSYIGFGVALPHAYVDGLAEPTLLLARHAGALTCPHSGQEIGLVFLVLSPRDEPRRHLEALSEISRTIMDRGKRAELFAAKSREALRDVFFS